MMKFAKQFSNIPVISDAMWCLGFRRKCENPDGIPLTSAYINAVLADMSMCLTFKGMILDYCGAIEDIPDGWALCDGENGTPNLTGMTTIGTNDPSEVKTFGGSDNYTSESSGEHSHGGSTDGHSLTIAQMPTHSHQYQDARAQGSAPVNLDGDPPPLFTEIADQSRTTGESGSDEEHSHTIQSEPAHTHEIKGVLPPHMKVYKIIKL